MNRLLLESLLILLTVLVRMNGTTLHTVWQGANRALEFVPMSWNYDLSIDRLRRQRIEQTPSVAVWCHAMITAFTSSAFGFTTAELEMSLKDVI
jgi:hypothetical protein